MMETIIAIACGLVVGGGILTLVWKIMTGDREQKKLDEGFAHLSRAPVEKEAPKAERGKRRK